MNQEAGNKIGSTITQIGSGTTVLFGLTLSEIGVIVGIITAIIGLCIQWYFGAQALKLKKAAYHHLGMTAEQTDTDRTPL